MAIAENPHKTIFFSGGGSSGKVLPAVILVSGSVLFWYGAWSGLNLTDDSQEYLKLASLFAAVKWGTIASSGQFSAWPPLFGFLIYTCSILPGLNPVFIQFIIMVCNFFLLLIIGNRVLTDPVSRILWLAASYLGVSFIMIHVFLWSEPIFLAIQLSLIIAAGEYIVSNKTRWCFLSLLLVVLLCLQRNAGLFTILAVSFVVFLFIPGRRGLISSILLFLAGVITFTAWNLVIADSGLVAQWYSEPVYFDGFLLNIRDYLDIISAWFIPRIFPVIFRILLLCVLSVWLVIIQKKYFLKRSEYGLSRLAGIIIIIYITGISSLGRIDPWEAERYLSVIYPLILLIMIKTVFENPGLMHNSFRRKMLISFLGIWIIYNVARSSVNVINWNERSKTTWSRVSKP
jgi:hypothetical protein